MTSLVIWFLAVVLFGLCVMLLLRAQRRADPENSQAGHMRRTRYVAILGMIVAGALFVLGFVGLQWWE